MYMRFFPFLQSISIQSSIDFIPESGLVKTRNKKVKFVL